jgi:hypothetical protein
VAENFPIMSSPRIAYLLGAPRSGTTLLSLLLNRHPEVHCPPEPWLMLAFAAFGSTPASNPAGATLVRTATEEFLGAERIEALGHCARGIYNARLESCGKSVFLDKTPRYHLCLDFIRSALPEARFLWIRRNPLDVAASYKKTWEVDVGALFERPIDDPYFFDFVCGLRHLAEFSSKAQVCALHYEALVLDPQAEISRAFEHLGVRSVPFDGQIGSYLSEYSRSALGDRTMLATDTIRTDRIGTYRGVLSSLEISAVLAGLGRDLFDRLGYGREFDEAAAQTGMVVEDRSAEMIQTASRLLRQRDRFARLEYDIHLHAREGGRQRAALVADHKARGAAIMTLTNNLRTSEAVGRAKEAELEAIEADRRAKDALIARLAGELEAIEADRRAKDDVIGRLVREQSILADALRTKEQIISEFGRRLKAVKVGRRAVFVGHASASGLDALRRQKD